MPIANDNRQQVLQTFGKSRPFFVPNVGQADSRLHYYVKGADYEAYFMPGEVLLTFQEKPAGDFSPTAALGSIFPQSVEKWNKQVRGVRLSLAFLDSNPAAKPTGRKLATRTVNYLKGNDSSKWHTNIPTYEHVVYPKLWPGIDLVFHGDNGRIKYEFVVQPGAKVADIRFAYRGAKSLSLDEQGNLLIHTEIGELREARPFSYQQIGGRKASVGSSFLLEQQLDGASVIRFQIGADYDPHYPLVIDPELEYSTYLGGGNFEIGFAIAVDAAGNAYVTGSTNTPETAAVPFPVTPGAFQTTFGGTSDAFVAKLNPAGNTFLYSTYLGGGGIDQGSAIAVDSLGNAYITGNTNSSQTNPVPFPITPGAFQTTFGGALDAFVTKLNPAGNALVYSTYLGGDSIDFGSGITVDAAGNAYIVGTTATSQLDFIPFPITPGAFQTSFGGNTDVFVTQLNAAGNALIYSTYLGGGSFDYGAAIAVDSLGNAYVTGNTSTPETDPVPFPITPGSFQTLYGGGSSDAFIAKLNATGSTLVYSTYLGGGQNDAGAAIAVDTAGNTYVAGRTATPQTDPVPFPITPGAFQTVYGGGLLDAFVTKLNPTGSALVFSTYLGGSQDDQAFGIALDSLPNVYVAGITNTPQTAPVPFPITLNAFQRNYGGGSHDAFVTSLNTAGNALRYSTYLGGGQDDQAFGISVDRSGNAYVTGITSTPETDPVPFPITPGAAQTLFGGNLDAFIVKIIVPAPPIPINVLEVCIRVPKIYDWVYTALSSRNEVRIPDECRPLVEAAILAGQRIDIQCTAPLAPPSSGHVQPPCCSDAACSIIGIRRDTSLVYGNAVRIGIVHFLLRSTQLIRVFADGALLCEFSAPAQLDSEIALCLPEPLNASNIRCHIVASECTPSSHVLLDGRVVMDIVICMQIQVETDVKLEVLAKLCAPRPNSFPVPVPLPSFRCPPIAFPPQCPSLFPR